MCRYQKLWAFPVVAESDESPPVKPTIVIHWSFPIISQNPFSLISPICAENSLFPWFSWSGCSVSTVFCVDSVLSGNGKLSFALGPLKSMAALSYARAAASAVSKVPSHTLAARRGSLISAAHFPHGLCRTPR